MRHLQHATLKRPLSGHSLGMVSSRLPEALLLSAVLWLGLTSAGNSSCSSMPCSRSFRHLAAVSSIVRHLKSTGKRMQFTGWGSLCARPLSTDPAEARLSTG